MKKLVKIGIKSDFELGTIKLVDALGERVLVANVGGEFFAISDNCPHQDLPMFDDGVLIEGCEVECSWHGSRFNVSTGICVQGPSTEDIHSYLINLVGDEIYLDMEES